MFKKKTSQRSVCLNWRVGYSYKAVVIFSLNLRSTHIFWIDVSGMTNAVGMKCSSKTNLKLPFKWEIHIWIYMYTHTHTHTHTLAYTFRESKLLYGVNWFLVNLIPKRLYIHICMCVCVCSHFSVLYPLYLFTYSGLNPGI